jgi:hypothetical protein
MFYKKLCLFISREEYATSQSIKKEDRSFAAIILADEGQEADSVQHMADSRYLESYGKIDRENHIVGLGSIQQALATNR